MDPQCRPDSDEGPARSSAKSGCKRWLKGVAIGGLAALLCLAIAWFCWVTDMGREIRGTPSLEDLRMVQAQMSEPHSVESLREWVANSFGGDLEPQQSTFEVGGRTIHWDDNIEIDGETYWFVDWSKGRVRYTATLDKHGIEHLLVHNIRMRATRVFQYVGPPDLYRAEYIYHWSANYVSLALVQSSTGLLADGSRWYRSRPENPPRPGPRFPIYGLAYFRPDALASEPWIAEFSEWTGDWRSIEVAPLVMPE